MAREVNGPERVSVRTRLGKEPLSADDALMTSTMRE